MMSVVPEVVTDIAQSIWRTVGVELVIFGVTMLVALALRRPVAFLGFVSRKKGASQEGPRSPKANLSGFHATPPGPLQQQPPSWQQRLPNKATSRPRQATVGMTTVESSRVVDEIFRVMQARPGVASASQALQLYVDVLRPAIGLSVAGTASMQKAAATQLVDVLRCSQQKHEGPELFSLLVQCAVRSQQCHLVERIIEDMITLSVGRSCSFYESTMKQLAAQKQYRLALWVYGRLQADGLEPSAVTCSCLVGFANEVGEYKLAATFFEKLATMTTPSIRAYMTILRVHAQQQDWRSSMATFRSMFEKGVKADSLCLNIVLATGVACDKLREADDLLSWAEASCPQSPGSISDVVSYNTVIKGFARRGDLEAARRSAARMKQRGLTPNSITFNTLIDAAVRSSTPGQAWEVLAEMRSLGLVADKYTCSIIVRGMSKGLELEAAHLKAALELMRESGSQVCDGALRSTLYHALLDAAQQAKDVALVQETVSCMRSQGVAVSEAASRRLQQTDVAN